MPLLPGAEPFIHNAGNIGVLVLHGFTGSPKSVVPWAQHLADLGYSVRAPRLPGHGTRWQDMNLTKWEDWYAEAEHNLVELLESCETVFVHGLSMGGSLALRLAQNHGDKIAGIVVVNPAVHTERLDRHLLPFLQKFVPAFPGITNDIKKPGQDEGGYTRIPLKAAHSLTGLWKLVKQDMGKVTQPLLLMRSAEDHVVEPSNSAFILANVSSTDAQEIVLEDSYHVATLDNDAELIFKTSSDFIGRLTAAHQG